MPTVFITGANRGLGLEFVRQYAAEGWRVVAACRAPAQAAALNAVAGDVTVLPLDVADRDAVAALPGRVGDGAIDILINNAGIYGRGQSLGRIDYAGWENVLRTNVLGPIAVTEALLPNLRRAKGARVALMSSKMGSIADNSSGGTYAYRSSKAALNATGRSLAHDLADKGIIVVLLHPGWVRTDMGGAGGLIEAPESVVGLRRVIAGAEMRHSGRFYAYDGAEIPW
jgi:NAD(P)-dependent dehydrogenase (short-subunit alcohol dehydrogenase family)